MKKISLFLLSGLCALLSGCGSFWSGLPTVKGSGNIASETRNVSQFDCVSVGGSGQMSIVQGDQESLTVEADDNLLPLIKSEVVGGCLKIGSKNVSLKPTRPIRYQLRLKNLRELRVSGALQAEAPSVKADHLQVHLSGSGRLRVEKLDVGGLGVHVSGSGDVQMAGKADHQAIAISGSGRYRAGDCESQDTRVHVSGSGSAVIWTHGTLDAHVSGSGGIQYYGSPKVTSHVSGSGSVRSLGNK